MSTITSESRARFNSHIYQLRSPWNPRYRPDVYVPANLHMLNGPIRGRCDPPVSLYWQPVEIDFAETGDVELFYSSALTAANTAAQFNRWVNGDALSARWNRLSLPSYVRAAWETIHPALRGRDTHVNDRLRVQDAVLAVIAEHGFVLAGGSALIDYDVVSHRTESIDTSNSRWCTGAFNAVRHKILDVFRENCWCTEIVKNDDFDKQVLVDVGNGMPVVFQMVAERRTGGSVRLIFDDLVGGKGVAVATVARGRDLIDLVTILETPDWSLLRVEDAMRSIKRGNQIDKFRASIQRFRRGEFDDDILKSGFDPDFCHRILE